MPRHLSKSRFKLALECVTKLYYTGKSKEYADQNSSDPFLEALAKGGFQVGELAKYYFSDNPVEDRITIETLDPDEALVLTHEKLSQPGRVVIAEGAFLYDNLFIRADLIVKEGTEIQLYEVKAKSVGADIVDDESLLNKKGNKVSADWEPYLYDLAFQKYVMKNSEWGAQFNISAHLLLVNKEAVATVEGLNQQFKIIKEDKRYKVVSPPGLSRADLGNEILRPINCDTVIDRIWNAFDVPTDFETGIQFQPFIERIKILYIRDQRHYSSIGSKCKNCQFRNDVQGSNLKSGFHECWKQQTQLSDVLLRDNLVTEIWGGLSGAGSPVDKLLENGIYKLSHAREEILLPKKAKSESSKSGLTPHARRMEQINRVKNGMEESYFDKAGLKQEMDSWVFPIHMVDFETSMVALPFHHGAKPYQGVAFQFSHHMIHADGTVEHKGQFLANQTGIFPNYDFARALMSELQNDNGTIFRYHNHENTYLNLIASQLESDINAPEDKEELIAFIRSITRRKNGQEYEAGEREMIDLYDLVLRFYYSPLAKGSNSIKKILPAIIKDSPYLREKYGRAGVYGMDLPVKSLNFYEHIWINPEKGMDPYKTLPSVFEGYDRDHLDELVKDFDELGDGGAALTAYNYLQFSEVPDEQRQSIASALLRYCELDTLAMVMLIEGWREMM
ncbi:MAG: hypothetical protein RLZZ172_204 [Bacteroidota bacterium]